MPTEPEDNQLDKVPERPLECSECKKPATIYYTEIEGKALSHTCMCAECPELQKRLQGIPNEETIREKGIEGAGLACGNCGTTLAAVKVGHPLGCYACYDVFGDLLLSEMLTARKVSPKMLKGRRSAPLHLGRAPGVAEELSPSLKLLALNEALDETLEKEDYEQAAWLRDQINALTKEAEDEEKK